jgi:hypothetical protein
MEHLYVFSHLCHGLLACQPRPRSVRPDRLENEHLGNVDQYRITREVPLPYSFDELSHETDVGDEDDNVKTRKSVRSSKSKQG